ncbi:MAG: hypothetical protein ACI89E_002046, partial [Planctomycetota bacterium]
SQDQQKEMIQTTANITHRKNIELAAGDPIQTVG